MNGWAVEDGGTGKSIRRFCSRGSCFPARQQGGDLWFPGAERRWKIHDHPNVVRVIDANIRKSDCGRSGRSA